MYTRVLKKPNDSILLLGPRGSGKSTWIKDQFLSSGTKNLPYYDLLDTSEALRLSRKPSLIYDELKILPQDTWVVIDEVQKVPELLNEVHRLIEQKQLRFILSGSSARRLKKESSNLLAGRAVFTPFFPLVSSEVEYQVRSPESYVYGMLPKAFKADRPHAFLKSYAESYLNEEIKAEALARNIGSFSRFLEIAARQNGQITNVSNISRDSQVARQTVQNYFEILVDTLLGFWLQPWKLKRATKQVGHPKFYLFDAGVCRALSGRLPYPPTEIEKGHLFETWMLHEIRAFLSYKELGYPIYFWSSHDQVEVDVLIETQTDFLALELKSTDRWESSFNKGLHRIRSEFSDRNVRTVGVYNGARALESEGIQVFPVMEFLKTLWTGEFIH